MTNPLVLPADPPRHPLETSAEDGLVIRPGRRWWLPGAVVVTLVVGATMFFFVRSPLWLDEALSVNIAKLPLTQLPGALRWDGAPPLYYVLLHAWIRVFGSGTTAVRSLSGVLALAVLPVAWRAGRRIADTELGWTAVLFAASSPFLVRFATETRMYALAVLLSLLAYLALDAMLRRPSWGSGLAVALLTGALLLTHYWAFYLVAVTTGALAVRLLLHRDRAVVPALAAMAGGCLLFLPWLPVFLFQLRHTGTPWAIPANLGNVSDAVSAFAGGDSLVARLLKLAYLVLGAFALFGRPLGRREVVLGLRPRPEARGPAVAGVLTLVLAVCGSIVLHTGFQERYTAVVFGFFVLLFALGTTVLADERLRRTAVAVVVALGFVAGAGNAVTARTQAPMVAAALNRLARPGDVVVYCPDQLGPSTSRLLTADVRQTTYPRGIAPARVDWVDYAKVVAATNPSTFAEAALRTAGPHSVWLVWSSDYRIIGSRCGRLRQALARARPAVREPVHLSTKFFEHARLDWFS